MCPRERRALGARRTEGVSAPPFEELDTADHWASELERTGAIGWRVSHANELYQMCRR